MLQPEKWVDKYGDYLYHYALCKLHSKEVCEDIVQDTFLSALKAKDQFKNNSNERTWLTSILKSKIADEFRRTSKTKNVYEISDFFNEDGKWKMIENKMEKMTEDILDQEEIKDILLFCLSELPAKYFLPFSLKYIAEEPSEDIKNSLHLSDSNFWTTLHRARIQLQKCIMGKWK